MKRELRKEIWQQKLGLARSASLFLMKAVPTIKGIALTGSVAFGDVSEDDDLDFLILTQSKRVFTTRFSCYFWAIVMGRKRKEGKEKNKWCLNMFLDEEMLLIPPEKRSAFAARQIRRMRILAGKDGIWKQFREVNRGWMKMANEEFGKEKALDLQEKVRQKHDSVRQSQCGALIGDWIEKWMYNWQMKYMKKKMTREVVNRKQIFFHPLERSD